MVSRLILAVVFCLRKWNGLEKKLDCSIFLNGRHLCLISHIFSNQYFFSIKFYANMRHI